MVRFKGFKIGDLFDKLELKRIKPDFDKRSDLSSVQTAEFDLPLVNAKAGNNGIMYYGRSCDWQSDSMTIDIVQNGAVSTGMVYAQPQKTGVLWDAYLIKLKSDVYTNVTVQQLLFLATAIQVSIFHKFNYSNKAVWARVQKEFIQLPVKSDTLDVYTSADIDWDYMASHIRELEASHIRELEAYLKEAGLDSYELTNADREVLSVAHRFGEFKVGDLFENHKVTCKLSKSSFSEVGQIPVYSSDSRNNGVLGYTELEPSFIVNSQSPTYILFGDHTKTINIVHNSFSVMDNVKVLTPKQNMTDEQLLYIKTSWLKTIPSLGYARHWKVASKVNFSLPLKPDSPKTYTSDDIDWSYMERFIKVKKKQVIASVVEYKDEILATTKEVIA